MTARENRLREWLTGCGGRATVAQFMAAALYHPEFGYYTRNIRTVGRVGDFSTSATLHPLLARAVARWSVEYGALTLGRGAWAVIEIGAGTGELAWAVRNCLPLVTRWRTRLHVVETSPVLRARQRELLGNGARWHDTVADALSACGGRALIYANELADAFPCAQLVRRGEAWRELFLVADGDAVREEEGEIATRFDPRDFSVLRQPAADGQRVELHETHRAWQAAWLPRWRRGALLTVDYGDAAEHLYARRPRGTLRAYFHHQRLEGAEVYRRMGRQDMTADVNFSDLRAWGEAAGCRTEFLQTQAEFITSRVQPAGSDAERMLLHPAGAGRAFKVLCQVKV
jgi:SAM-dependent MidA family methyltransferase